MECKTNICKTEKFKDVLNDLVHSFRQSVINLTNTNIDIKLTKIRTQPIPYSASTKIEGTIKNLVGGKISCIFNKTFVDFIDEKIDISDLDYNSPLENFMDDVFDIFSTITKNNTLYLSLGHGDYKWENNKYFIQFELKVFTDEPFQSNLIIGIDEMTTLYFEN